MVADFLLSGCAEKVRYDFDVEEVFSYFQGLLKSKPDDPHRASSLGKVCRRVLRVKSSFSQSAIRHAAEIAVQLGDPDLLELAMSACQHGLPETILLAIGRHLSSVALDLFKKV